LYLCDYVQEFTNYPHTVLHFDRDKECLHPTQKPILLNQHLILTYSNPGDLVLDNCAGGGSTLLATANTGRNFMGVEKEKKYYDFILSRLQS
jgi:site-specific DNA-methyltransferase (adenine-specific)